MANQEGTPSAHEYELGHSERELERLRLQAQLVDPFTRDFFHDAGLRPGMTVLEIGCGAGDTTLVVSELIGESGSIFAIDRAEAAVAAARNRVQRFGKSNIAFHQADPTSFDPGQTFDAIVGRYVLMFNPDPAGILRALLGHLRPGGVVAFHEVDWHGSRSSPKAPLYEQCTDWIVRTFEKVGTNPHMGPELHSVFLRSGAGAPTMALRAAIDGHNAPIGYVDLLAELAITMMPKMEEQGVVAPGDIDPATFRRRVREEVERLNSVVVGRSEIGAWARVP